MSNVLTSPGLNHGLARVQQGSNLPESSVSAAVITSDATGIELQPDNKANQCQRCQAGRGCGLGFFTSLAADKPLHLAHSGHGLDDFHCGESVTLKLPEGLLLRYVVLVLLAPAMLIALSAVAGHTLALNTGYPSAAGAAAGMLSGLIGGAVLARIAGNRLCGQLDQPLLVEKSSARDQE